MRTPGVFSTTCRSGAFLTNGILHHLNENFIALVDAVADPGCAVLFESRKIGKATRFARAKKSGAIKADIDKSRLHAGQDALHPSKDDVSDQAMA